MIKRKFGRICLIVLDSVGIGEMPDAAEWNDKGADTLGNILKHRKLNLPNLQKLGLGNIRNFENLPAIEKPIGCYGKCALKSNGKDTTTGHWEIAGIILEKPFPTYPNGFPTNKYFYLLTCFVKIAIVAHNSII
jgi:phosphopentomutase